MIYAGQSDARRHAALSSNRLRALKHLRGAHPATTHAGATRHLGLVIACFGAEQASLRNQPHHGR